MDILKIGQLPSTDMLVIPNKFSQVVIKERPIYIYSKSRSTLTQTSSHSFFLTGVSESARVT